MLFTIDPRWRTSTVLELAKVMNETQDWDNITILGDALEDVGCDNPEVMQVCRGWHRNETKRDLVEEVLGIHKVQWYLREVKHYSIHGGTFNSTKDVGQGLAILGAIVQGLLRVLPSNALSDLEEILPELNPRD